MTQRKEEAGKVLQSSLFRGTRPESYSKPGDMESILQDKLFAEMREKQDIRYGAKPASLVAEERRARYKMLAKFLAIAGVFIAAGYGVVKAVPYVEKKLEEARYSHYINSVSPEDKEAAAVLYENRKHDVKLVDYDVGEDVKKAQGLFDYDKSTLTLDYDVTGDGKADYRVSREINSEIFFGWQEGDYADEKYGPWRIYKHPLKDVLDETRDAKGRIKNLHTGKEVKFGGHGME